MNKTFAALAAAVAIAAGGVIAVAVDTPAPSTASSVAASCAEPSYDGQSFSISCAVPQATATVIATETIPGPTTTAPGPTVTVTASPEGPAPDPSYPTTLFFDGFSGSSVDGTRWNVRNNSWANNELSIDTNRPSNVLLGNGSLVLRAQRESYTVGSTTRQYTSGYLDTISKFSASPPLRVDARMKLPNNKGLWPALWMRGNSTLGEVDILEAVGGWAHAAMTVHQSTNGDMAKLGYEWAPPAGFSFQDSHNYSFEWDANGAMRWLVDGNVVRTVTTSSTDNKGAKATWLTGPMFASPFNIRLNLQVGGSMPNYYGYPVDAATPLPGDFAIDWLAVRQ